MNFSRYYRGAFDPNIIKQKQQDVIFMIKNKSSIRTDAGGKELPEEEGQLFNITVNNGDIHQFVRGHIPSHWHKELEIFVLLEGRIQLGIGDAIYSLQTGDGCFINTEVLHAFTADVPTPCTYRSFVFHPDIVGGTPGSIFDTAYVRPLLVQGAPFVKFQQGTAFTLSSFAGHFKPARRNPMDMNFR